MPGAFGVIASFGTDSETRLHILKHPVVPVGRVLLCSEQEDVEKAVRTCVGLKYFALKAKWR